MLKQVPPLLAWQVTDASGARLDFSRGRWLDLDRGIVAAPAHIHGRVLQAVAAASQH